MPMPDDGEPTEAELAQDALDPALESFEASFGGRWGHAWLEWEPVRSVYVGVVAPTPDEILEVTTQARAVGWIARIVPVRYSAQELSDFLDRLHEVVERHGPGKVSALGEETKLNKVFAVLDHADPELIGSLQSAVPGDSLIISVDPSLGYYALASAHRTQ